MGLADDIRLGKISLLAAEQQIIQVEFNGPDGQRVGVVESALESDILIVKSWLVGLPHRENNFEKFLISCYDYQIGGSYPPGRLWSSCQLTPIVEHDGEIAMASGGEATYGKILFTLKTPKKMQYVIFCVLAICFFVYSRK